MCVILYQTLINFTDIFKYHNTCPLSDFLTFCMIIILIIQKELEIKRIIHHNID